MKPRRQPRLEGLEDRTVPAAYGVPWTDPTRLSLSVAPDGTAIAGHVSDLEAALDGQGLGDWRRTLLTAFQSWAAVANLDFGWRADEGLPFGTTGLAQNDPRFGDIRLGGQSMSPEALAVAVTPDATLGGTWSGDVLFNTDYRFDGSPYSLLAVAMHEAGHALGLANSPHPGSIMYTLYNATRTNLSGQDVRQVRALYGVRTADPYEGARNNNAAGRASALRPPTGFAGETPLVAFGSLSRRDVDHFRFTFPDDGNDDAGEGEVTVRVQTAGRSLMAPKLTVYGPGGRVLATQSSSSLVGDTLQVRLTGLSTAPGTLYTVRVEAATDDVFGVGRYGLSVRFDKKTSTDDGLIDRLLRGPYDRLGPDAIDAFFRTNGDVLLNADDGSNERPATATRLAAADSARSRFEGIGSVAKIEDADVYRVVAPGGRRVLTATTWTADATGFAPSVRVLDGAGREVPSRQLVAGDGRSVVQVDRAVPGRAYFLEVTLAPGATQDKGNYQVAAAFGGRATGLIGYAGGELGDAAPDRSSRLYVGQTQLFHFLLTAGGEDAGARVVMTIRGEGGTERRLTALAGAAASASVLLTPGAYTVTFVAENLNGRSLRYSLAGAAQSDPMGPVLNDPTLAPRYPTPPPPQGALPQPTYTYPGFSVPYDPSGYLGYVNPVVPASYPPGYVLPSGYEAYPWLIVTDDPFYWIALGS